MTDHVISCPNCRHAFPLDLALREDLRIQVTDELAQTYDQRLAEQREELTRELVHATEARLAKSHAEKLAKLETKLSERDGTLSSVRQQLAVAKQQASEQAQAEFAVERKAMEAELARQATVVRDLRGQEIALRREKQQLEETRHHLEVEHHRALDAARQAIRTEISEALAEETRSREIESQRQQDGLKRQVEELRRRLETNDAIAQGEVLELRLEEILRRAYPHDLLEPVPRGVHGGDLRQVVTTPSGCRCGTILWEAKKTQNWDTKWTAKMKADQHSARAEVGVIVSHVLPKDLRVFGQLDGVWVVHTSALVGFSLLVRCGLLELAQQRHTIQGQGEKATRLLNYVCGHEQRQHFEAVLSSLLAQQDELSKEQRALRAIWNKRQKQIESAILALSSMYGDLNAIVGSGALPSSEGMELMPTLAVA